MQNSWYVEFVTYIYIITYEDFGIRSRNLGHAFLVKWVLGVVMALFTLNVIPLIMNIHRAHFAALLGAFLLTEVPLTENDFARHKLVKHWGRNNNGVNKVWTTPMK